MKRRYRRVASLPGYLAGAALARTGDELSGPALLLFGLTVTGSPGAAAALLAGLTAAAAIGGPVLGARIDASADPGRTLAFALAAYSAGLAAIVVALPHLPTAPAVAVAVVTGLFNPAVAGGWTAQLPRVLGSWTPARAHALDAMTFSVAGLLGPGLAGLLAGALGAPAGLAIASALVLAALPVARSLPARTVPPVSSPPTARLRAGFGVLARNGSLRRATVVSTLSYVGIGIAMVCFPLVGGDRLGGTGRGVLLLTVVAVAALLTNAVLARWPPPASPDSLLCASLFVLAAGFLLVATATDVGLLVAGAAVVGMGEGPQLTALFGIRHRESPDDLRAQVFTTAASLKITGFAAGAALAGPLVAESPVPGLAAAAAAQLLGAAGYRLLRPVGKPPGKPLRKPFRKPSPVRDA